MLIPDRFGYGTLSDGGSELDLDAGKFRSREMFGGDVYVSGWCASAEEALAQTDEKTRVAAMTMGGPRRWNAQTRRRRRS